MSQSLFLNIQYEFLQSITSCSILYFFSSSANCNCGYLVQTDECVMDMEFTGEPVTRFLQDVKLCLCEMWGTNEKKLCKEQKTGQYCWVSYQICRNHFDWSSIGTNYWFCLLYLTVMTYKFAYHIMLIQCFIAKKVVINIIRYGLALASPPTFMHERGI